MDNYLLYIPLIALILYFVLLGIILTSERNKVAIHYIYYIISVIIWSFGSFMMRTELGPSTLFYNRILVIGFIFVPVTFYHFTIVLTKVKRQATVLKIAYVYTFVLFVSNFFGLIIKDATLVGNDFQYEIGPLAPTVALMSLVLLVLAFYNTIMKVKNQELPFARVRLIIIGLSLVFLGSLFNLVPALGKYPIDVILNVINAVLIAYSIYRYRFLEVRLIVKRGLTYFLSSILLGTFFLAFILILKNGITDRLGYTSTGLIVMFSFLASLFLEPIKKVMQRIIDHIFYVTRKNHQRITKEYGDKINAILSLNEFEQHFRQALTKGVSPRHIHLCLQSEEGSCELTSGSTLKLQLTPSHPMTKWFMENELLTFSTIDHHPLFKGLWTREKDMLISMNIDVILPIRFRSEIIGLVMLSEKKSGESYSYEDIEFIQTLINLSASVIENAKRYEKAQLEAITDSLTHLYNHRYFYDQLNQMVKWTEEGFALALIDIDLFKFYNDLYGHSEGDEVLIEMASILKETLDKDDMIVRYGGEEFAVITPAKTKDEVSNYFNALRQNIASRFASSSQFKETITVSMGVALYPLDSQTAKTLVDYADRALYFAKHEGRNQVVLFDNVKDTSRDQSLDDVQKVMKEAHLASIYALSATIDAKDSYTFGHSDNLSKIASQFGRIIGLSQHQCDILKNAGLLHDIGKIGVPEPILTKPDKLTKAEYEIMKRHVDMSVSIIKHIPNLMDLVPAIMNHHERWDGNGYPRGITGEGIPIEARIISIVDAFEAMVAGRPYKPSLSVDAALEELHTHKGTQFDPNLVDAFIQAVKHNEIKDIALIQG